MNITTVRELMTSLREGPYTSVGSYPKFWYTHAGEVLSYRAVCDEVYSNARYVRDRDRDRIIGCGINWEDPCLYCDETNERIESAYAEEESEES
jgi:hypothetical protein